jgi:hypothetical protein
MGWITEELGFRFSAGARDFSLLQYPDQLWGPHTLLPNGYLGVKWHRCEANHSLPSSADITNGGDIPLLPHMSLWCGA